MGKVAILIIYVDGIIFELLKLKKSFTNDFEIKDFGPSKYFLGMEFAISKARYLLVNISMY